jgi:hypothetical protein
VGKSTGLTCVGASMISVLQGRGSPLSLTMGMVSERYRLLMRLCAYMDGEEVLVNVMTFGCGITLGR